MNLLVTYSVLKDIHTLMQIEVLFSNTLIHMNNIVPEFYDL